MYYLVAAKGGFLDARQQCEGLKQMGLEEDADEAKEKEEEETARCVAASDTARYLGQRLLFNQYACWPTGLNEADGSAISEAGGLTRSSTS